MNNLLTKHFRLRGSDGNDISISETKERKEIVICIQQNDDNGRLATIRLTKEQLDAFWDTRYRLDVFDASRAGERRMKIHCLLRTSQYRGDHSADVMKAVTIKAGETVEALCSRLLKNSLGNVAVYDVIEIRAEEDYRRTDR